MTAHRWDLYSGGCLCGAPWDRYDNECTHAHTVTIITEATCTVDCPVFVWARMGDRVLEFV